MIFMATKNAKIAKFFGGLGHSPSSFASFVFFAAKITFENEREM